MGDPQRLDNMGYHVARGDEVDVAAAPLLQVEHHMGEFTVAHVVAVTAMVDFPVLAEAAQQVAVGEKDRTRAAAAHQLPLLSEVGTGRVDLEARGRGANPGFAGEPVRPASASATLAAFEHVPEMPLASLQLAARLERQIAGFGRLFDGLQARFGRHAAVPTTAYRHRHSTDTD